MSKKETKNVGPIIGTLIVIIVLIAIALYVFASHVNRQALINSDTASSTIIIQSGDDVQSLKNDLNNVIK
jgi:cell division protein YceG involved in septum cleavage